MTGPESGGAAGGGAAGGGAPLVAGHPMPPLLAEAADPGLVAWRDDLPGIVEELLARWSLTPSAPFRPGGSSAWVAPVREVDGSERVLKVAWAHDEARDEAAGMVAWQGRGAARVHRSERRGATAALLLDRVRPGTPLAQLLTWPERDEIVVAVARQLWVRPEELLPTSEAGQFRTLSSMCAWWADGAQERAEAGLSSLPADVTAHGLALFRELPRQWDGEQVLLATDLHPSNVLAAGEGSERRWVLIDPKPYVGDPHYDLLQHMFNDPERLAAEPSRFAGRMASLAGLDPARARRWLLARCVQESAGMEGAAQAALRLVADGVE
ncbi:aminoglycoside phosphotransferase family protein [Brachybacterium sp. YJGR34]|uniref:aminoglycoside phosphotransferase family protein n=1 Tax=Brachybacterium sp. YJGR34 TaxID=2059911 RepID=UPI001E3DE5E7|nr:aminoglycoside phosphotransferase family protein [Brachybacterium sp. YJGR34]